MAGYPPTNPVWTIWAKKVLVDSGLMLAKDVNYEMIEDGLEMRTFKTFSKKIHSGIYVKFNLKDIDIS